MSDLFLSLGSNIRPRRRYLIKALELLNERFKPLKVSSLYITEPVDDTDQDDFYNICAYFKAPALEPEKLLTITREVEELLGRVKDATRPKGPRVIDIDILLYDDVEVDTHEISIPHKSMFDRRFVLEPLMEIMPEKSGYIKKYNLFHYFDKSKQQKVEKIGAL